MKPSNTFNINRFALLFKQNLIHNYKLISLALVAFSGGLFILLLIIQFLEGFRPQSLADFINVFVGLFIGTGIICAGTAFPGLRSKERSHHFLMNPASTFEKFLMEFLNRIVLFILVVPVLYWTVYNVEGYVVNFFYPEFSFQGSRFFPLPELNMPTETAGRRMPVFVIAASLLIFVIPFTGSTIFFKSPLIKTLFAVAVIFFFHLFLIFFFIEILEFRQYHPTTPILFIRHLEDGIMAAIIATSVLNIGLISAAYFKLKEREV